MKVLALLLAVCTLAALTSAEPQCPAHDGATPTYFPDESDPNGFWECSNGEAIHQNCAPGLVWNTKINDCDWP